MDGSELPGKSREVGRSRNIHGIFPVGTPEEREVHWNRLERFMDGNNALCPVIRVMTPGEPRVRRFKTLIEADADWLQSKARLAVWLESQRAQGREDHHA